MIWLLLIVFQLKHFIADYLLQGRYMLGKFKEYGWVFPLAAHCGVHLLFTLLIAYPLVGFDYALDLAMIDFIIHFIMDRIKASPNMLGQYVALSKSEMYHTMSHIRTLSSAHNLNSRIKQVLLKQQYNKLESNKLFWWSLGFDQLVHHLTDILIIYLLVSYG